MVGEEITGRDFHLIAVGIEQAVDWNQPADAAIDQVHAQGGVAIAAHPLHGFVEGYDERALAQLDGLEAAHPDALQSTLTPQFEEFYQRTLARNREVAAIGSSDFHLNAPMGRCRTYLLVRERSEGSVIDAIRDGRYRRPVRVRASARQTRARTAHRALSRRARATAGGRAVEDDDVRSLAVARRAGARRSSVVVSGFPPPPKGFGEARRSALRAKVAAGRSRSPLDRQECEQCSDNRGAEGGADVNAA